ncbi:hypothetical protein HY633_00345 [Candidatus Uhrbacteria bacterium]|nr:hypothetical protein [Candidatus Uhrbacteria bacterium]
MNPKTLKKILTQTRNERRGGAPREAWVSQNRDILLMQVRNTMDPQPANFAEKLRHVLRLFVPVEALAMAARTVGVFVLVLGTVLGGGLASVQAYRDALPGEVFYKVKMATEKVQLTLAPNDDYRARLHVEFADRRAEEIARLAEATATNETLAANAVAAFTQEVAALEQGLEALRNSDPEGVIEVAKLLERKFDVYQGMLRKAGHTLPTATKSSIAAAIDMVDGASIKAIAVIVEKHLAGDLQAPQNVLVTKFEDRLKEAEAKIANGQSGTTQTNSTKAKAAIAEAKAFLKKNDYQAALLKIGEIAELTKETEAEEAPAPETEAKTEQAPAPTASPVQADDAAGSGSR